MQIGPFVAVLFLRLSFKSEQILFEKSLKVKGVPLVEILSSRHEAATLDSIQAGNLALLEKREKLRADNLRKANVLSVPPLVPESGRAAYSRRVVKCLQSAAARLDGGPGGDALAAPPGPPSQPLGNNTESRAVFSEEICQKTGEIQQVRYVRKRNELVPEIVSDFSSINARAARFAAQSSAGKLLHAEETPRGTQWRVTGCSRRKVAAEVSVLYSASIKKAHFGGLMVCGSVWTCPPCAAKVSERRKNEVVAATDMHKAQGGGLYMVTLTTSHKRDDDLGDWLARFSDARARMRRQRAYRDLLEDMGHVGNIRSLEVTYGDANGWHPHEHSLWLLSKPLTARKLQSMRAELFRLWHRACRAAGLPLPNRARGVDVRVMESAAEYIAKFGREPRWGAASEMTKQHSKTGGAKSMTPFDLLRAYHEGSEDGSHKRFGALFVQFAKCFFGKRQVIWSDGLKELFGIEQQTDEELAAVEAEDAAEVIRITGEQWRVVLHQKHDVRQILLERAETGGFEAVSRYLLALMHRSDVMLS